MKFLYYSKSFLFEINYGMRVPCCAVRFKLARLATSIDLKSLAPK